MGPIQLTIWLLGSVYLVGAVLTEEGLYTVTITSNPPYDPFISESSVSFSCLIDPPPPEPVTYQWRILHRPSYSSLYSGQNISIYFGYGSLRFSWIFCSWYSNTTQIAYAQRQVQIQGLVYGKTNVIYYFVPGGDISLSVQDQDSYLSDYIHALTWYHNNTEITSSQRVTFSNDFRNVNITSTSSSDAGVYQVKITGMYFDRRRYRHQNPACDSELLHVLETQHAAFAPINFLVEESQQINQQCEVTYFISPAYSSSVDMAYFSGHEQTKSVSFLLEKSISFPITLHFLNKSLFLSLSTIQWFHNGEQIIINSDTRYNDSYAVRDEAIHVSLLINNMTIQDLGVYTCNFGIDILELLTHLPSCDAEIDLFDYYFFIIAYLNFHDATPITTTFIIEEYRDPKVLFTYNSLKNELTCKVIGGNPEMYNHTIWLIKSNMTISQAYGNKLSHIITSGSTNIMFGVYICFVESLHSSQNVSIFIPQKVEFQLLVEDTRLVLEVHHSCQYENASSMDFFLTSIIATINFKCDCNISRSNFEDLQLSCLGYGQLVLFSSTLVYSNDDGTVLASNLVNMLLKKVEETNGEALNLQGTGFKLANTESYSTSVGALVGIFMAGCGTGVITLALAVGVTAGILKKRKRMRSREATSGTTDHYITSEEMKTSSVEIQPNSAYEAVRISQQCRPVNIPQRHQQTPIDNLEVVYDVPS